MIVNNSSGCVLFFFNLTPNNRVQHLCHIPVDSRKRISLPTAGANSLSCRLHYQISLIFHELEQVNGTSAGMLREMEKMTTNQEVNRL